VVVLDKAVTGITPARLPQAGSVIAGVSLYLGDQFVLVLGGDRFVAARAGHADGHDVSLHMATLRVAVVDQ
jgi:hypothetical protein